MSEIILKDINKIYDNNVQAVFDFNLEIKDGEFIVLVGPSGCGKSTVLRMICGLESITSGDLLIDNKKMNHLSPCDRKITMVFQNYALYGNMTVYDNMGFSKKVRKASDEEIYDAVVNASEVVDLEGYLNRYPKQLSGGQRQRVALGRSIVADTNVFLLDEPLSNLDAKLRAQTRKEITLLHNRLKSTMIYVTHDQIEAMTLADRIVVMKDGHIQQVDSPKNIYDKPVNTFVATFIGTNPMNLLKGLYDGENVIVNNQPIKVTPEQKIMLKSYVNKNVIFGVRPEFLEYSDDTENVISGELYITEFLGNQQAVKFNADDQLLVALIDANIDAKKEHVSFKPKMDKVHFFDCETSMRIR